MYNRLMAYEEITAFVVVLLAIAGGVNIVGSAIKTFKEWLKPAFDMNDRLKAAEEYLDKDNKRIADLEEAEKLILSALSVQLEHEISGNHIDKLQKVQSDINQYLINR